MSGSRRYGLRGRLLLTVVAVVAAALGVATLAFNLVLSRSLDGNANDLLRARGAAEVASLEVVGGRLQLGDAPDTGTTESLVWVFAGSRTLEEPRVAAAVTRAARRLAGGPQRFADVAGSTRLYATPVVGGGRQVGTVVTGLSLAPYNDTKGTALIGSLALAALLLAGVALTARWLLASALRPVARMTSEAAEWSERDLDRRFGLGEPHDELTRLASTLDGLLDRIAASLRREQRVTAEISHELRTPLAAISAEAELALRRDRPTEDYRVSLKRVLDSAERATKAVEILVAAAQQEAGVARGTADAEAAAAAALEACASLARDRAVRMSLQASEARIRVGVDGDIVERILQPVIENACRYGRKQVQVSLARSNGAVLFAVADDGAGVSPAESASIFEPGKRGAAGQAHGAGAGLGLALARRLARSVGGDVGVEAGNDGARFVVRLPAG